ncbi:MAG TPA: N-acetyltransferase [Planctomycetota bacterium]|nr:N-acetyltransferase [Planctomycetota bacterium]
MSNAASPISEFKRLPCEFRRMVRNDLPHVLEIEGSSFRLPWSEERFLETIGSRGDFTPVTVEIAGKQAAAPPKRAAGKKLVGYFVLGLKTRSMHLANLAIHPEHRRRGYASQCLAIVAQLAARAADLARQGSTFKAIGGFQPAALRDGAATQAPSAGSEWDTNTEEERVDPNEGDIYLEVEESNLPAQLLYRKLGFRATRILRNYYPSLREDGYHMARKISAPGEGAP